MMKILETYYETIINFLWQDYLILILLNILIGIIVFSFVTQFTWLKRLYVGFMAGLVIGCIISTPIILFCSLEPGEAIGYDIQLDDTITVNEFTE